MMDFESYNRKYQFQTNTVYIRHNQKETCFVQNTIPSQPHFNIYAYDKFHWLNPKHGERWGQNRTYCIWEHDDPGLLSLFHRVGLFPAGFHLFHVWSGREFSCWGQNPHHPQFIQHQPPSRGNRTVCSVQSSIMHQQPITRCSSSPARNSQRPEPHSHPPTRPVSSPVGLLVCFDSTADPPSFHPLRQHRYICRRWLHALSAHTNHHPSTLPPDFMFAWSDYWQTCLHLCSTFWPAWLHAAEKSLFLALYGDVELKSEVNSALTFL